MIACIGKNDRGKYLFEELRKINPKFVDLGVVGGNRRALWSGFIRSMSLNLPHAKREARFSPDFRRAMTREAIRLQQQSTEQIEAVIYWGATNVPVDVDHVPYPWYVVTDGPFDPADETYPVEWRPKRWSKSYFEEQRLVFNRASHVFTLSEWARQKIISVHRVPANQITKIGWGPLGSIGPALQKPKEGKKLVLSVGSDWHRKGMDVVSVAGELIHRYDSDIETVIIGDPNGLKLQARKGVHHIERSLPSTVVHTLMRQSLCVIVASRFDASPHVIPEALQYGIPVIGSRVCGIPEALCNPNGRILKELTATTIAEEVKGIVENLGSGVLFEPIYQRWSDCASIIYQILNKEALFAR